MYLIPVFRNRSPKTLTLYIHLYSESDWTRSECGQSLIESDRVRSECVGEGKLLRDEWEGIGILDCSFIEFSVILARLQLSILLVDKEEGRGHGRFEWSNISFCQVLINEFVQFDLFRW